MIAHHSHTDVIKRLKRARGHLDKVVNMIEDETPCIAVSQQLHAVSKAIVNAKNIYVKDHIDHCFTAETLKSPGELKTKINEFKEIAKYLQ